MRQSNPNPSKAKQTHLLTHTAMVIALAIMGDSLMYNLLPLEAENLGIPLTLVGVLLSANRIIRLFSNTWAGLAYERWGPRLPFIFAAILTLVTTLLYGIGWGFLVFLVARAGWGIAWSAFRQGGYQAVWAAPESMKGRLMGVLWGIVRLGSAVSVVAGGFLYDRFGYTTAVWVIAGGTALSIPAAMLLRWPKSSTNKHPGGTSLLKGWQAALQTAPHRRILAVGFMDALFEGILVSTLSLYLSIRLGGDVIESVFGIGTLAGFLLALRFSANLVFSPLLGAVSDRLGQSPTQLVLAFIIFGGIVGAASLPGLWAIVCIALVFFAGSGLFSVGNAAASNLANQTERPNLFVGIFSTAIDAGAAVGPLIAFSIGGFTGFELLYIFTAGLLLISSISFWQAMKTNPPLIQL